MTVQRQVYGRTTTEHTPGVRGFFEESHGDLITVIAIGAHKEKLLDGDDAQKLAFVMAPTGGSATVDIYRTLDEGRTYVKQFTLGPSANPVEHEVDLPLGWYYADVTVLAGTKVRVAFRKKVPVTE